MDSAFIISINIILCVFILRMLNSIDNTWQATIIVCSLFLQIILRGES